MTNSKAYNIKILCELKGIDPDSDEAKSYSSWKVLDLLNAIRDARVREEPEEFDVSILSKLKN